MAERVGVHNVRQSEVGWVIRSAEQSAGATKPEKTDWVARLGWGLELRKQWLHQGL